MRTTKLTPQVMDAIKKSAWAAEFDRIWSQNNLVVDSRFEARWTVCARTHPCCQSRTRPRVWLLDDWRDQVSKGKWSDRHSRRCCQPLSIDHPAHIRKRARLSQERSELRKEVSQRSIAHFTGRCCGLALTQKKYKTFRPWSHCWQRRRAWQTRRANDVPAICCHRLCSSNATRTTGPRPAG